MKSKKEKWIGLEPGLSIKMTGYTESKRDLLRKKTNLTRSDHSRQTEDFLFFFVFEENHLDDRNKNWNKF